MHSDRLKEQVQSPDEEEGLLIPADPAPITLRTATQGGAFPSIDLLAADWERLNEGERDQAVAAAAQEGRCAARRHLQAPARNGHSLRDSRWAREHGGLDALDDATFWLFATSWTIPGEEEYLAAFIEPRGPEETAEWWEMEPERLRADPRVCIFCDGYERERRVLLGLPGLPTRPADLQLFLCQALEEERDSGRMWLARMQACYSSEEEAEWKQTGAMREYERCIKATDLAEMLLAATAYRGERTIGMEPSELGDDRCIRSG